MANNTAPLFHCSVDVYIDVGVVYSGGSRVSGKGVHINKGVRVYLIFPKYPMKMKFGLSETKLFHFHRIFKNGGEGGGGSSAGRGIERTP